jgi:squalene-associated FAD-dependent desaturase
VTTVTIIGGGLSGMAAAAAAVERGFSVELFEQAKQLGGRAGSFVDPATGMRTDCCRHIAMGCCTEFLDFCRRTEVEDCFARCRTIHFIAPDGAQYDFTPSRRLPAPLHLLPGLFRLNYLAWSERWGIVRAMRRLMSSPLPKGEGSNRLGTIAQWLREQNQSPRAVERFWSTVLISALGETVDHISTAAARKVFLDGFWSARNACELILPQRPLGEIFHDRVGKWLADRGVRIHLGTTVRRIEGYGRADAIVLDDGTSRPCDRLIVAVPWHRVRSLLSENLAAVVPASVEQLQPAAITAVHLWFDRRAVPLPHAALVGRLGQWVFADEGQYCQVVVSASHRLPERSQEEWISDVCGELASIWPQAARAGVLHGRAVTQPAAVFSMAPGADDLRPSQQTRIENLVLAGDWTATGWPGTMESAVRSGRRAVAAL